MKHENAKARGMGEISAGGIGMNESHKHAEYMDKSMPETPMGTLDTGFSKMGGISSETKSDPAEMCPGQNNVKSRI
jgi:hypothetical protein